MKMRGSLAVLAGTVLFVALGLGFTGCRATAPSDQPTALVLTTPWTAGEISRLQIASSDTGAPVADWEMEVAPGDQGRGWVLISRMSAPGFKETTAVHVLADSLLPTLLELERETAQGKVTAKAVYEEGKVVVTAETSGRAQPPAEVKLPDPPYFDNEQFVLTLRALPLAKGFTTTLADIVSKAASKALVTVSVNGPTTVTVPAGTFACWVVELQGTGQRAWIAVDAPHQIVQFANDGAKTISKLTEFRAGN